MAQFMTVFKQYLRVTVGLSLWDKLATAFYSLKAWFGYRLLFLPEDRDTLSNILEGVADARRE
jgi:hypothetical protein